MYTVGSKKKGGGVKAAIDYKKNNFAGQKT